MNISFEGCLFFWARLLEQNRVWFTSEQFGWVTIWKSIRGKARSTLMTHFQPLLSTSAVQRVKTSPHSCAVISFGKWAGLALHCRVCEIPLSRKGIVDANRWKSMNRCWQDNVIAMTTTFCWKLGKTIHLQLQQHIFYFRSSVQTNWLSISQHPLF